MKSNNIKIILTALIAAIFGLGAGYLIFKNDQTVMPDSHKHSETETTQSSDDEVEEWICSMHPQIRQPEFGLCPICEMDLIPAGSNNSDDPLVLEMTEEAVKLANIQTTVVGNSSGGSEKSIKLTGKIQADERRAATLVAHLPGRIEQLFVTFTGEKVNKGQKLATLYSPDLISAQRELLEALKLKEVNPNLVEAARNKLRFWKISDSTIEGIEKGGKIKETFTVFAESSGVVNNRRVSVGDYVRQGEALFDLMNLNKVWVLFDAYEEDLANIRNGDKIEFSTPSSNKKFTTRITFIDPVINPNSRTASVRAEVNNSNGLLKPEMLVTGILKNSKIGSKTNLTVPKSAVLWTGKRSVVYVKMPDAEIPSFQYREVELGESLGNNYQISEGLEAGEEVVTYGSFTIDAASQLNNQTSMMNKNAAIKKEAVGVPNFRAETPDEFKKQLNAVANEYINLKDAFVATDANTAAQNAQMVAEKIENVDMSLIKGDAHEYWMQQLNALKAHSQKIIESNDVEVQRRQFGFLSEALINSIEAFGTSGEALYVQHCPMAFNNEGADWLATEEAIQNPYFGNKMMKCGLVKKTFLE